MGQPATTAEAAAQEADEVAIGTPATAEEMAVRRADDVAMGQPATSEQQEERRLTRRRWGSRRGDPLAEQQLLPS